MESMDSENYLVFYSCQEAEIRHDARRLNKVEEHLSGYFHGFYQNLSCRTHHNFARKQNFLAEHIKILPDRLKFVNYVKDFCIEHLQLSRNTARSRV